MSHKKQSVLDHNLILIFGVTLTAVMGVSSITPAFPKIMQQLGLTDGQVGLLITVFTLPGVFLTPVLGIAADRYGRKKILFFSLLLFGIAGGLCGFTRSFNALLTLRFFQGVGAAALGSMNVTIIGDLYQGSRRAEAMGLNASVLSIGTASYPLIGGGMATFAWYYPFLLPWVAIPISFLVLKFLNNPEPDNTQDIRDYFKGAWQSIRNKQIVSIFATGILVFIILYGSFLTYFSIFLGQVFEASSFIIGTIMFISSLSTAAVSSQLGKLNRRFTKLNLLRFGFSCYIIALLVIAVNHKLWLFVLPMIIFGVGHGLNIPNLQTLLAEQAPLEYRAIFMSLNGAMLRIGQSLGPPLIGIAYTFWSYNGVFISGALLSVMAVLIVNYGLRAPVVDESSEY